MGEYYGLEMDISEYTSSITGSTDPLSGIIDIKPSDDLNDLIGEELQKEKPKRGRKPLRPNDPIRTKTEEKDKFWLRAFRGYMRKFIDLHWKDFSNEEKLFWKFFFSANGKPGKKRRFLSYGKKYKQFLFGCEFFKSKFQVWFEENGPSVLEKKYRPGTNEWFVYYNYCETELFYYNEKKVPSSYSCPVVPQVDDLMEVFEL